MSPAGSSSGKCRFSGRRKLIQDVYDRRGLTGHLSEMYERYERERKAGIRVKEVDSWRKIVRWEVERIKREEA